jgi:hypothetical protein
VKDTGDRREDVMSQTKKLGIVAGGIVGALIGLLVSDVATMGAGIAGELRIAFVLGTAFLGTALGSWVGKDDRSGYGWRDANQLPPVEVTGDSVPSFADQPAEATASGQA